MSTTLEMMVKYLAGRGDREPGRVHRELQDSSSEASLFLEALRERSRTMFDTGVPAGLVAGSVSRRRPGAGQVRGSLLTLAIAAMLFVAIGVGWWDRVQLRRLEALQTERDQHWKDRLGRLELALGPKAKAPVAIATPPPRPPVPAPMPTPRDRTSELLLARLEDGLSRLDERLKEPEPPKTESEPPTDDQVRRDIDTLKRDMNDREKALRQDLWEMRSALQGVIFMLRQMEAQASVGASMPMQFPTPFPGPMLGPATGRVSGPLTNQPSVPGLVPSFPNATQHHPEAGHPGQHPAQHPDHRGHR